MEERKITANEDLIAYCGLYCGACPRYLKAKCNGCKSNNPSWCEVKPCNLENHYSSCANCKTYNNLSECKKYNPLLVRFGQFLSKTRRSMAIEMIKRDGPTQFARYMANNKLVSIKK